MNAQSPVEIMPVEFAPAPASVAPPDAPEQHDGSALLSVIARAASDPRVDIDKFERLAAIIWGPDLLETLAEGL